MTRQWKTQTLALAKEGKEIIAQYVATIPRKDCVILTLNAQFEAKEEHMLNNISKSKADNQQLPIRFNELKDEIVLLTNAKGKPLRYTDLYAGGILSKQVDTFTFFSSIELNDTWLKLINFTDDEGSFDEGNVLRQNLHQYSKMRFDERKGDVFPSSYEPESEEYAKWLKWLKLRKAALGGLEGHRIVTKIVHIGVLRGFSVQCNRLKYRFEVNFWS